MMKPILISGITLVNLVLIFYSTAIVVLLKRKRINKTMLSFLTLGVIFDMTSTLCMIIGSGKGLITLHGLVGYSSLTGMITDTVFTYLHVIRKGNDSPVSKKLYTGSLMSYSYWVIAYITGIIIIILRY